MSVLKASSIRVTAFGLAGAALLVASCADNSLRTADRNVDGLGSPLVMLGLRADPDREMIEYGPRAPLVIPGNSDELPPPEQRVADHGLDWPDDPDVRTRREIAQARRAAESEGVRDVERASEAMSRAELDEWGRRFGRVSDAPRTYGRGEHSEAVSPEELRAQMSDPDADDVALVEPPRRRLTEPPAGYRRRADTGEVVAEEEEESGGFLGIFSGRSAPPPDRGSEDPRYDPANR